MIDLPSTPSFRLDGRRALVAGGTSGIGLGAAVALAEANAQVSIIARSTERLEDVARAFKDKSWPLETISLDIADVDSVAQLIDGQAPFDIVVNSAGLARHSPATQTTQEDYDAVTNLNVRGAFFLIQAAAKRLIAAGKPGSMMTISSQMAKTGGIERSVYCATKHAVEGFTKAMAIEFGPHRIRVNTICPTFIRTPLTEPTLQIQSVSSGLRKRSSWDALARLKTLWARFNIWPLMLLLWSLARRCLSMEDGPQGNR